MKKHKIKNYWNGEAKKWDAFVDDKKNLWTRRSHMMVEFISKIIPTHGNSLDLGCGPGVLCGLLAEKGFTAHGVDISENMLSYAKNRNPNVSFAMGDEKEIPFNQMQFSLITAFGVLEYIENRQGYIQKITKMLRPGGIMLLSNSNNRSFFVLLAILSRLLRLPLHPNQAWIDTIKNLSHTGIWSGGKINHDKADNIYNANSLDHLAISSGMKLITSFGMFNFSFLDCKPFLVSLQKSRLGRSILRKWAWNYIGVYRKPCSKIELSK